MFLGTPLATTSNGNLSSGWSIGTSKYVKTGSYEAIAMLL
jgi:hypothetical protein